MEISGFFNIGGKGMNKEEATNEDIIACAEALNDVPMPMEGRTLKIVCPHCGEIIDIVGENE